MKLKWHDVIDELISISWREGNEQLLPHVQSLSLVITVISFCCRRAGRYSHYRIYRHIPSLVKLPWYEAAEMMSVFNMEIWCVLLLKFSARFEGILPLQDCGGQPDRELDEPSCGWPSSVHILKAASASVLRSQPRLFAPLKRDDAEFHWSSCV